MRFILLLIVFAVAAGCLTQTAREPARKNIGDYATQCRNITDNYKIPVSCGVTRAGSFVVLQVYYPSLSTFQQWHDAVIETVAAPFCVTTANELQRQSAVQFLVQDRETFELAHQVFDCETHEMTGWAMLPTVDDSGDKVFY